MPPEPLTGEYLKAIQDRIAAASKGPWTVRLDDHFGEPCGFGPFTWVEYPEDDIGHIVADIEFAAHARVDTSRLYGEVSRLNDENRLLRARIRQLESGGRDGR